MLYTYNTNTTTLIVITPNTATTDTTCTRAKNLGKEYDLGDPISELQYETVVVSQSQNTARKSRLSRGPRNAQVEIRGVATSKSRLPSNAQVEIRGVATSKK